MCSYITINITINDGNITKKNNEKLPGVNFKHLDSIKKADRKVNAFSKILPYMNFEKKPDINELVFTS